MNKSKVAEAYGWYGTVAILLAYALLSFKVIPSNGYIYQLLNLTGSVGILIVSLRRKASQPAVLNIIWSIIAVIAILALVLHH